MRSSFLSSSLSSGQVLCDGQPGNGSPPSINAIIDFLWGNLFWDHQGNSIQLQPLLDLAAEGSDEAYGELISQASERLLKLTRRMLRDFPKLKRWEQTDDVFQTAALRLYRSLAEVQPDSVREFFGLGTTQIRRTLIDLARQHFGPEGHGAKHHTDGHDKAADDDLLKQQLGHNLKPESSLNRV